MSDSMSELLAASAVVLVGLAGASLVAYRLNWQRFFVALALAWGSNLVYLLAEATLRGVSLHSQLAWIPVLLTYPTTLSFVAARHLLPKEIGHRRTNSRVELLVVAVVGSIAVAVSATSIERYRSIGPTVAVLMAAACQAWALAAIASVFARLSSRQFLEILGAPVMGYAVDTSELDFSTPADAVSEGGLPPGARLPEVDKVSNEILRPAENARLLFVWCLSAYALLQFGYLLEPLVEAAYFESLFWIGLAIKALFGVGLAYVILADFRAVSELSRQTSLSVELAALTASVDHDIRNPLSSLQQEVRNLKFIAPGSKGLVEVAEKMDWEIDRIRAAVSVIPEIKESTNFFQKRLLPWNLLEVIRSARTAVSNLALASNSRIEIESTWATLPIRAYRERLVQVFVNLFVNALEAYELKKAKSRTIRVAFQVNRDTDEVTVVVRDEAGGIDPRIIGRVTEAHFSTRSEEMKRNRGIGLFTARRHVEQHGGSICIDSDGETFTEVSILLPLSGNAARSRA